MRIALLFFICLSFSTHAQTGSNREQFPSVALSGVLGSKVILSVNGQRHVISQGATTPEGIKLLKYDHGSASIQYKGNTRTLRLGETPVSTSFTPRQVKEAIVYKDEVGMYRTSGKINGRSARLLVDTGATLIAMSTANAKALGIDYLKLSKGQRMRVGTANGVAVAYPITLNSVSVGDLEAKFVKAAVIEGQATHDILLGMSYISRFDVEQKGGQFKLQTK